MYVTFDRLYLVPILIKADIVIIPGWPLYMKQDLTVTFSGLLWCCQKDIKILQQSKKIGSLRATFSCRWSYQIEQMCSARYTFCILTFFFNCSLQTIILPGHIALWYWLTFANINDIVESLKDLYYSLQHILCFVASVWQKTKESFYWLGILLNTSYN